MPVAFERLHSSVKRTLWDMGWNQLRPIQVDAISWVLDGRGDLVIAAETAGGKTEAAFLPVISRIAENQKPSVQAIYVGPLKALINDQFSRLEDLCRHAEIAVHRWHGDVSASAKRKLVRSPTGILLITPESIESLFVNRSQHLARVFGSLEFVVVDEIHSFMGTERGTHLLSLLNRLESLSSTRPARIGLSATIGDMKAACEWLKNGQSTQVGLISGTGERDLAIIVHGYLKKRPVTIPGAGEGFPGDEGGDEYAIAMDIFQALKGKTNLVFGNQKGKLEYYTDLLNRISIGNRYPPEFLVHHGSLSKQVRQAAEHDMRSDRPSTTLCTNTLELGIDVGFIDSVGQLDPPFSVGSLIQRMGRSGRTEGAPAKLRFYIQEVEPEPRSPPWHNLHLSLLQAIAMVELLVEGWCETPQVTSPQYSTLVQQILSVLAQTGGIGAQELYSVLVRKGPFKRVSVDDFRMLLQSLGDRDLLEQMSEGDLILGLRGERIVRHYDFYAAFATPEEYRIVSDGRDIGTLPSLYLPQVGHHLILAGKRWKVVSRDDKAKLLVVNKARGAKAPKFVGGYGDIDANIRCKMLELLVQDEVPTYLDRTAATLLQTSRSSASQMGIHESSFFESGQDIIVLTWTSSRINRTLELVGRCAGFKTIDIGVGLVFEDCDEGRVQNLLHDYTTLDSSGMELVQHADVLAFEKYDEFLPPLLLAKAFVETRLDIRGARAVAAELVEATDYRVDS